METRLIIAYALIALLSAAVLTTIDYYQRKRAARRRIWEGRGRR